jgi:hypothetical protein
VKISFEGNVCKIEGLTADAVGADPKGAAAAARLDAIQYAAQQIERISQGGGVTADQVKAILSELRGKPWGLADLGGDGKLWEGHRPPLPTPGAIGAVPNSERGKPWGLAELGADGRLWEGHRPPLPTPGAIGAVPNSERGKPWGLAELGGDGLLWEGHRPPLPTAQQVGADPAGSAVLAQRNAIAFTQERVAELQAVIESLYPVSAFVLWGFGKILAGAPFGLGGLGTNIFLNRYAIQSPAALGDEVEITFLLRAGNYRLDLWGMRNNQQGVFDLFLNDAPLATGIDRYAASGTMFVSTFNVTFTATRFQKLRTKVTGKNPSSVGFQIWTAAVVVYPI